MRNQDHPTPIEELEKTIRILRKKLERSEKERGQIESDVATKEALLKNVIHELQTSKQALEKQSQDLQNALEKMQMMQLQMIQSEKMSALGQTTSGIAHEINNPVSFIHGNLTPLAACIQDLFQLIRIYHRYFPSPPAEISLKRENIDITFLEYDIPRILQSMATGTRRIRDIVLALRNFSRLGEVGYKAVDLHEGIDNALMILQQKMAKIQVFKHYGELPPVTCVAGDLNQVFMNILSNAVDAIAKKISSETAPQVEPLPENGIISIRTEYHSQEQVVISIADNGVGIPPNVIDKVFDPFFTTKEIGKGTGLGLAIARQIVVEKHGGSLDVHSEIDQGTKFLIRLPIHYKSIL
ncbi:MAG: GHKL domain-containing protein [Timaviella obliquedivisa GSE-PSE-MK23-08B]|jgi:signal transduction histidine kinase|nr:GHKL domain-containing protein [Timaviella obliquedivisa GSE-PSE-MK23-08B]